MNSLFILLGSKCKAVKNYVQKRLDLVTRIEIFLFFGFLLFYCLFSWNRQFGWILKFKGQVELWNTFVLFCRIILVSLLTVGYTWANKQLRSFKNEILLSLPVSRNLFARERLLDFSLLLLLFYPVWMALFFLFAKYADISVTGLILLAFAHTGWYFFAAYTGLLAFLVVVMPRKSTFVDYLLTGLMVILLSLSIIYMVRIPQLSFQALYGLAMPILAIAAGYSFMRLLVLLLTHSPERLAPKQARAKYKSSKLLLELYTVFIPRHIKALVIKDCTYIFRNFKSFLLIFTGFFLVLVIGIGKSTIAHDGIQWFLSMNIAAAWVLANSAFRFVEQRAENLAIIRSLPIKATTYWWGKFWLAFLPVIWLVIAGMIAFIITFGFKNIALYSGMAAVLFIAFTLIFVQNNFALYSYPYPRYAVLWYNLFLILAISFFTVLLSPLITIGFLVFGYTAIFWVLKRINNVEIIND